MTLRDAYKKSRALCRQVWHRKINFIELHYLYIGFMCFLLSGLFYCQPGSDWAYIDSLYMATSVATNTGLNTIDMSDLSTYQMLIIFFFSILTSHVSISVIVVNVRKYYFSRRFKDVVLFNRALRLRENNRRLFEHNIQMLKRKLGREHGIPEGEDAAAATRTHHAKRSATMPTRLVHSATTRILHPFRPIKERTLDEKRLDLLQQLQQIKNDPNMTLNSITDTPVRHAETPLPPTSLEELQQPPPPHLNGHSASGNDTDIADRFRFQHNDNNNKNNNILFANNIEYQREQARKELQECNGLLNEIASVHGSTNSFLEADAEQEAAEIENIISRPVYPYELTRKQRYCIGGAEYRAIDFLSKMVPLYYVMINTLFVFAMRIYIACSPYAQNVLNTSNPTPVNPWYFSFIVCFSAFNNLGYSPLNASMVPFQNAPAPLLITAILIMLGNTGYAIALRGIIWVIYKLLPRSRQMDRETMRFLLDNPRRCYTSLFRSAQTWWLVFVLVAITVTETVVFVTTNFWLPVVQGISWASRVLDGFFQGVAVRNAGFAVVNLLDLNPGTQIVYIIAMYISVYPVAISIRNSNIYQERELGIYSDQDGIDDHDRMHPSKPYSEKLRRVPTMNGIISSSRKLLKTRPSFYVMTHLQRQLTHELSWLLVGIFCVCVVESESIMSPSPITALTVIYECVSAFGTSGSSTGYPNISTSQSAKYHTLGKLVIIALMYRGRHRGLPSAIDHSVLLPSEKLDKKEELEREWRKKHAEFNQSYPTDIKHRPQQWRQHSCHTMV